MQVSDQIFQAIKEREAELVHAKAARDEVYAMPNATEIMRDAANAAVSHLIDTIKELHAQFIEAVDAEESAVAAFDVAGTVTLNDVSTPVPGETYEQRVLRLAQKAVIEGCEIVQENEISAYVTSSRNHSKAYWVGVDRQFSRCACECDGFRRNRICKHLSLVLLKRGIVKATNAVAA